MMLIKLQIIWEVLNSKSSEKVGWKKETFVNYIIIIIIIII